MIETQINSYLAALALLGFTPRAGEEVDYKESSVTCRGRRVTCRKILLLGTTQSEWRLSWPIRTPACYRVTC